MLLQSLRFPRPFDHGHLRFQLSVIGLSTFVILIGAGVLHANAEDGLANDAPVPTYHADAARSGHYVFPGLTWVAATKVRLDAAFDGRVPGNIYAQPLYWHPPGVGAGAIVAATEDNAIVALNTESGSTLWKRKLGPPAEDASLPCSNIAPLGHRGYCGDFRGAVIGVRLDHPAVFGVWRPSGDRGGIWAPGGIAYDGDHLFVATNNTVGADNWSGGEAVIRLPLDLNWQATTQDYFSPGDWRTINELGRVNPLPIDLPDGGPSSSLLIALGRDKAYLLDRAQLGGIDHPLAEQRVANVDSLSSPTTYRLGSDILVAFRASGSSCPGKPSAGLLALRISRGPPVTMSTAWCAKFNGQGAPIVTTIDGSADPIVWIVGAEGDDELHGFRGDTGEEIFTSDPLTGLRRFVTILSAAGRLYVAGDGRVLAFRLTH
jgi:hypothetical protein